MNETYAYEYWLASVEGFGPAKIGAVHAACGSARECFFMPEEKLELIYGLSQNDIAKLLAARQQFDPDGYEKLLASGVRMIGREDPEFPEAFRQIPYTPRWIFVRGRLPDPSRPRIAIVGARMCSDYGRAMARTIASALAAAGAQIISGMARGIDSHAHLGALSEGMDTYAVLGCGVNVCYPPSSKGIYEELIKTGGVLSEYPPDLGPQSGFFPVRNRLISALSDAVIVIEARKRSGSLITADHALEQGKDIYALPGRITDPLSGGTNRLIAQGAMPVVSVEELMRNLALQTEKKQEQKPRLNAREKKVYRCLTVEPKGMELLLSETDMSIAQLSEVLLALQKKGWCEESFKNCFRKRF